MNWASDNPEKYDEVCRRGIVSKLGATIKWYGGEVINHETVDDVVCAIHQDPSGDKVYDALMAWANKEICEAEADHHASMVDDAMERQP